jgi:hypothetical protein
MSGPWESKTVGLERFALGGRLLISWIDSLQPVSPPERFQELRPEDEGNLPQIAHYAHPIKKLHLTENG